MNNHLEFLKQLDEKFEEKEKQNLESLKNLTKQMRTFEIDINGNTFVAYLPPSSLEKQMIEDVEKVSKGELNFIDFCKKYLPIWYGIPEYEIENIPVAVLRLLVEGYVQKYSEILKKKSLFLGISKK